MIAESQYNEDNSAAMGFLEGTSIFRYILFQLTVLADFIWTVRNSDSYPFFLKDKNVGSFQGHTGKFKCSLGLHLNFCMRPSYTSV